MSQTAPPVLDLPGGGKGIADFPIRCPENLWYTREQVFGHLALQLAEGELPQFPMRDQVTAPAPPPDPDLINENNKWNCVAEALASAVSYLQRIELWGDTLKDIAYGESHKQAGTHPDMYAGALSRYKCRFDKKTGSQQAIAGFIREATNAGLPTVFIMPSAWGSWTCATAQGYHAGAAYAFDDDNMWAMNPWGGFRHVMDWPWWLLRLCWGAAWVIEKAGELTNMIDLTNAIVAKFFAAEGANWRCKTTGHVLLGGLLAAYRDWPARGDLAGLTDLGLPLTGEIKLKDTPYAVCQLFERGVQVYDPQRTIDGPAGATGPVYSGHLDLLLARKSALEEANRQLAETRTALDAARADDQADQAEIDRLAAKVNELATELAGRPPALTVEQKADLARGAALRHWVDDLGSS